MNKNKNTTTNYSLSFFPCKILKRKINEINVKLTHNTIQSQLTPAPMENDNSTVTVGGVAVAAAAAAFVSLEIGPPFVELVSSIKFLIAVEL